MMINLFFTWKNQRAIVLLSTLFVLCGFQIATKQTATIVLQDQALAIAPKEFYIANVTDERADKSAIAWLLRPGTVKDQPETYPVDLQGGGLVAVKQFVVHNLPHNVALRPVVISIRKFRVTEKAGAGGEAEGHAELALSFSLQQEDTLIHLVEYTSTANYTRNMGLPQDVEPTIRHMLVGGLTWFDTWINKQAATNIKLAKTVSVTFTDYTEKPEGDTIYYSPRRLLNWDDFKGKTPQSRFAAEVYPTIGYDEHAKVEGATVYLNIDIKVSLPKSACWVRDGDRTDYVLNHEQRHFDLARIAAEHFKQRIKTEKLPVGNYDGYINVDYLDAFREMDNLQKQYDDETVHGTDHAAQARWNEKIDRELKLVVRD